MSTTVSSTTAIELSSGHESTPIQRDTASTSSREATDPILEASRLGDMSVPDGGYGWVVIFSCAVLTWWYLGTSYAWGIIQSALVDEGLATPSTLAWIGSIALSGISILAIVSARVLPVLGARATGIIGVLFFCAANVLSSFAVNSVVGLFFTAGLINTIGVGMCFMVVTTVPSQYFHRKRGLANGIVFAGGGLGGAVISFIVDALIQRVGVAWMYRIVALMTAATALPAAYLIQERVPPRRASLIDRNLLKNVSFGLIFASSAIGTFPLLVPPFFLPLYSRSIGLSPTTSAGLLAGFNLSSGVGRIMCGIGCDKLGSLNMIFLCLVVNAVTMLALWPVASTLPPLVVFVTLNGMANGGFFATIPTAVSNVFGSQRVAVAMAMVVTGWLGGYVMGAPIAGYLLEAFGGTDEGLEAYRPAMFYAGGMALIAAVLIAFARLRLRKGLLAKV